MNTVEERLRAYIDELQAIVDRPIDTWGDTIGSTHYAERREKERTQLVIDRLKACLPSPEQGGQEAITTPQKD
jgi:hypothetical protein